MSLLQILELDVVVRFNQLDSVVHLNGPTAVVTMYYVLIGCCS